MTYRYFYSSDESDLDLRTIILAAGYGSAYTKTNGIMEGTYEYKIDLLDDNEYNLIKYEIERKGLRAVASPDRMTQFGTILPSNFFDSTKYVVGTTVRSTGTLAAIINLMKFMTVGKIICQRDIDIQGSAALGTVELVLSSSYNKTYNVPINGSVHDSNTVKVMVDTSTPSVTETAATCNSAMFDYETLPHTYLPVSCTIASAGWYESETSANTLAYCRDSKLLPTANFQAQGNTGTVTFDYGSVLTGKRIQCMGYEYLWSGGGYLLIQTSSDNVTYTTIKTYSDSTTINTFDYQDFTNKTFRYLRWAYYGNTGNAIYRFREVQVRD